MKKFSTKQKLIYSIIAFFSLIIVSFSTFTFVRGIHFSKIQNVLIQGIRDAKYLIWAAVAWFSNEEIYNELLIKKQQV